MRLLHLSDTHFGAAHPALVDAVVRLAHHLQPEVTLLSGDWTQRATPGQWAQAQAFVQAMPPTTWVSLPGNHDLPWWPLWERLRRPYARFERCAGGHAPVHTLRLPGLLLLAVDTTRWWRHQYGAVSRHQTTTVAQALRDSAPGDWRLVATHHPLALADNSPANPLDRPWRHRQALRHWQAAGMAVALSGHVHQPALQALPGGGHLAQVGSATSWRLAPGQTNSVAVLQQHLPEGGGRPLRHWLRYDHDPLWQGFVLREERALPG